MRRESTLEVRFLLVGCVVACAALALDCKSKASDESNARIVAEPPPALGEPAAGMGDQEEGGAGARAAGDEGKLGRREAEDVDRMAGVRGPANLAQLQGFGPSATSAAGTPPNGGAPASPSPRAMGRGYGPATA